MSQDSSYVVIERDEHGQTREIRVQGNKIITSATEHGKNTRQDVLNFAKKLFLPSGYPHSVTPGVHSKRSPSNITDQPAFTRLSQAGSDVAFSLSEANKSSYRYQILNALQAACNSLASLIASRAVLEGQGVGDASANPTYIMLTNLALDGINRVATILGAYIFGSSLAPECKTYRFLADVLNDAALVSDALSSLLTKEMIAAHAWRVRFTLWSFSATCRALSGLAAGGSKAAISLHFASPLGGTGDLGDLSAKDSSKETALALLGMVLGSFIVPRLTTPFLTYSALLVFVGLHLAINYAGVVGLHLRTLNRQRASMAWAIYRQRERKGVPTPAELARQEPIFSRPDCFRDVLTNRVIAQCTMGSSFAEVFIRQPPTELHDIFQNERYILWYDDTSLSHTSRSLRLHVILKEGCTPKDHLKAWLTAVELATLVAYDQKTRLGGHDAASALLQRAYQQTLDVLPGFLNDMRVVGWNTDDIAILPGAPKSVLVRVDASTQMEHEDRKFR